MAVLYKTYETTEENCHGFTNLLFPQCRGHSRELQIKSLNHCCPRGWGKGVVTDDWYISKYLFPAYKNKNVNIRMCKRAD